MDRERQGSWIYIMAALMERGNPDWRDIYDTLT